MAAGFVIREVLIGNACIARRGWSVRGLLTHHMARAAAIVSDQRSLKWPRQTTVEAKKHDRTDPVPAGQDVRNRLHLPHRCDVRQGTEVGPRLVVRRECYRNWNNGPGLAPICAMR